MKLKIHVFNISIIGNIKTVLTLWLPIGMIMNQSIFTSEKMILFLRELLMEEKGLKLDVVS